MVAYGRNETPEQRADRRWNELLQEVRVAQTGVQILLAFLLTAAFAPRFTELTQNEVRLYVLTLMLGAGSTGALIAPVVLHRFVTGRRLKPETVEWASKLTIIGLFLLLCTVVCAMLLVSLFVLESSAAYWVVGGVTLWFALCWFSLPVYALLRHSRTAGS
ncbi:DUF6328 family protein [Streptomyces aidingensis]|uniref:Integral membrane protein n=1 Tax=Streptomyces aidingensis TaxID=910347 RepID=A0A1I1QXY1_9ACTN|nr:DUF6328 family protein [Streptomyces aidingensis]SFD24123.1 hypothetical protein SAMN05421773_111221 [Streptomyces aidingensis]